MVAENESHEILKKKGMIEQCRKLWWKHREPYQVKYGGDKKLLENLVTVVIENGCKASCGL